jgi:STE24 endopeptidase
MHAKEIPKALAAQLQEMDDEHNSKTRLASKDTTEAESPKEGDDQSKKPKVAKIVPGKALDAVQSTHVNARVYNLEKSNFGFITGAFNMAENTLSLVLGFSPFLWVWAQQLAQEHLGMGTLGGSIQNEICVSLIFMLLGEVYNDVVHIPFELYSTFVIEERHGFNKQTAGIFVMDKIKGYALQVCLMYPIMALVRPSLPVVPAIYASRRFAPKSIATHCFVSHSPVVALVLSPHTLEPNSRRRPSNSFNTHPPASRR